jgi:hypothetical protein
MSEIGKTSKKNKHKYLDLKLRFPLHLEVKLFGCNEDTCNLIKGFFTCKLHL